MSATTWERVTRLLVAAAFVCGVIGLVAGLAGHMWKLGVTGWFTGGVLLAVIAIAIMIDRYVGRQTAGA